VEVKGLARRISEGWDTERRIRRSRGAVPSCIDVDLFDRGKDRHEEEGLTLNMP
jgi:hypothetical protein